MEPLRRHRSFHLQPHVRFSFPDLATSRSLPALRQEGSSSPSNTFGSATHLQKSSHLRVHSSVSALGTIREQEVQRALSKLSGQDVEDETSEEERTEADEDVSKGVETHQSTGTLSDASDHHRLIPAPLRLHHAQDNSISAIDFHPIQRPPSRPSTPILDSNNMLTLFNGHHHRPSVQQTFPQLNLAPQDLEELSTMLYTRGRLQELGCTFTMSGELVTYGAPASSGEFDSMLRLGPVYDEQWRTYFAPATRNERKRLSGGCDDDIATLGDDVVAVDEEEMWSDLATLQRVLRNEGVQFGWEHRRITHGDASLRIIKLCNAYDDLRTIWAASRGVDGFGCVMQQAQVQSGRNDASQPQNENTAQKHDPQTHEDEGYGSMNGRHGNAILHETMHTQHRAYTRAHEEEAPCNVGWRFSDDFTPPSNRSSISYHALPQSNVASPGASTPAGNLSRVSVVDWATALRSSPPIVAPIPPSVDSNQDTSPTARQEKGRSWHSSSTSRTKFPKVKAIKRWFGGIFAKK